MDLLCFVACLLIKVTNKAVSFGAVSDQTRPQLDAIPPFVVTEDL